MAGKLITGGLLLGHYKSGTGNQGTDYTLLQSEYENLVLEVKYTLTANINVILPANDSFIWVLVNSTTGNFTLTAKTAGGSGVTVEQGKTCFLRADGTNIVACQPTELLQLGAVGSQFGGTASVTVANTTTETSLSPAGAGSRTIPAGVLTAGRSVRIQARGVMGSSGASNLTLKLKLGSTVIGATPATSPANPLTNRGWELDFTFTCRTTGSTGTIIGQGMFRSRSDANTATGNLQGWELANTTTTTIDTTVPETFDITATYSAANATDTITLTNLTIEILA